MILFELENLRAYTLLLRIEVLLRELIRISMEAEFGMQWQKRLPGDLLTKIRDSQISENRPQFAYVRLGPLYYLTFGELLNLLRLKSSRTVVEKLGGEFVLKQIESLTIPRNAVCHSRPVSMIGLKNIETLYAGIETALTKEFVSILMSKPDTGIEQSEAASVLINSFNVVIHDLPFLPAVFRIPSIIPKVFYQFWWTNDLLAGFTRSYIESAITTIQEYNAIQPGVGCAGLRLNFIDERKMLTTVKHAVLELEKVKK
jgi:hypothetical protein